MEKREIMIIKRCCFFLLFLFSSIGLAGQCVDDLRFFPNFAPPRTNIEENSLMRAAWFATTASVAYSNTEETKPIFALFGDFDLNNVTTALELVGKENPLRLDLQGLQLPFFVDGIIHTQAFYLQGEYVVLGDPYNKYGALSVGSTIMAIITNAAYKFRFNRSESSIKILTQPDIAEIEQTRKKAFSLLGIYGDHAGQAGFGDVIVYLRHFHTWDFTLKFRAIQAALTASVLIPSGFKSTIFQPLLVPAGGNGHWGVQFGAEGIFQIREDLKLGVDVKVSQRFKKTMQMRVPINKEPYVLGALIAPIQVQPGATLLFSPYFVFENLRDNLNLGIQYTLIHHIKDDWTDMRLEKTPAATLQFPIKASGWASEYVTIFAFYAWESGKNRSPLIPSFEVLLDIPCSFFNANHVPKTYRACLNVTLNF